MDHIIAKTNGIHSEIEKAFSVQLEATLKQMHWPTPGMTVPLALEKEFQEGVRKLLELQKPDLEALESSKDTSRAEPLVLLPLQVMARHLELAFRFHFEGDRPMNKLDRPEYFLNHVIEKFLTQYAGFMEDNLQPILLEAFRGTSLSLNSAYIDSTSAFITAVLPMVRAKIFAILPRSAAQPQLLSHLIHEIMSFDATIREDWGYDAGNRTEGWRGLAYEVLSTDTWFPTWLKVEKDCEFSLLSAKPFLRQFYSKININECLSSLRHKLQCSCPSLVESSLYENQFNMLQLPLHATTKSSKHPTILNSTTTVLASVKRNRPKRQSESTTCSRRRQSITEL